MLPLALRKAFACIDLRCGEHQEILMFSPLNAPADNFNFFSFNFSGNGELIKANWLYESILEAYPNQLEALRNRGICDLLVFC